MRRLEASGRRLEAKTKKRRKRPEGDARFFEDVSYEVLILLQKTGNPISGMEGGRFIPAFRGGPPWALARSAVGELGGVVGFERVLKTLKNLRKIKVFASWGYLGPS